MALLQRNIHPSPPILYTAFKGLVMPHSALSTANEATTGLHLPKLLTSTLLSMLLSVLVVGCGGGGTDATPSPSPTANPSATPGPVASCTKTNAKVGQVATLSTRAHMVSGQAKVVDDCTIEISNFNYDGGGLTTVYAYGAIGSNFGTGFKIGPNLKGKVYSNQTLTLTLSAGDLDKLDSLSIWCEDAKANFGSGVFAAP
jgi:hypothetical protein